MSPDSPLALPAVPPGAERPAWIRDAAVAVLRAYKPLSGTAISRVHVDPMQSGDYPAINVFLEKESRTSISKGAGAPSFEVRSTIGLQLLVQRAGEDDAIRDLDALRVNVLEALLADPIWPRLDLAKPDGDLTFDLGFKTNGELLTGEALASIECGPWTEIYDPRVTSPLNTVTLQTDAGRPFDPNGTYTDDQDAGFPAAAAPPRANGPDGRIEIAGTITFPAS
jgi:hypothetical protein